MKTWGFESIIAPSPMGKPTSAGDRASLTSAKSPRPLPPRGFFYFQPLAISLLTTSSIR